MTIRLVELEKTATSVGRVLRSGYNVGVDLMKSNPNVKEKILAAGVPDLTKLSPESVATGAVAKAVTGLTGGLIMKPRSLIHKTVGAGLHQVNAVKRGEPTKIVQTVSKLIGKPILPKAAPIIDHEGAALFEKKKTIGDAIGNVASGAANKVKNFGKSVGEAAQRAQLYNTINKEKIVRQKVPVSSTVNEFMGRLKERMSANK